VQNVSRCGIIDEFDKVLAGLRSFTMIKKVRDLVLFPVEHQFEYTSKQSSPDRSFPSVICYTRSRRSN
jgi:hypothetical protein